MIIYGFPLSPFVRKVAVAATEKGIAFDWVPSNPSQPTEEFLKASPFSKIPAMADGDFTLADSTAIVTYLDAKYPAPGLIPREPKAAGRAIWFEEVADTMLIPAGAPIVVNRFLRPVIFGAEGDEAAAVAAEEAIKRPLDYLEGELGDDGWLDGEFSVGDIAVASTLKTLSYTGYALDAAAYPRLTAWYGRVTARDGWKAAVAVEERIFKSLGI
jgi:glutathione S-transferase